MKQPNPAPMSVNGAGHAACAAGLSVVPVREDGSKSPDLIEWRSRTNAPASHEELDDWFGSGERTGLGLVMGLVSGKAETLDFDCRETYDAFIETARACGLGKLIDRIESGYSEDTPSGGVHWIYRCDQIAGSKKLAHRPKRPEEQKHPNDKIKTLIETKGEGGFVVVAPSHGGVHETGKPYVLRSGGFDTIVLISTDERQALFELARTFDQPDEEPREFSGATSANQCAGRPGDDFAARTKWLEILEPHGWTRVYERGEVVFWRRPGKTTGISATTNHAGSDLFYPFSTSTEFEADRGYGKFAAYAVVNHNGDFRAAARALRAKGFGEGNGNPRSSEGVAPAADCNTRPTYALTDTGNAEYLADLIRDELLYATSKAWLHWDGTRWRPDEAQVHVLRAAKKVSRAILAEAANITDDEYRRKLGAHALTSESAARQRAMVELVIREPGMSVEMAEFDRDPLLFNVLNGTIDLRTGELRSHDQKDRITKLVPVKYNSAATCPRWNRFLDEVFCGRPEITAFVQRLVGYSMTGLTTVHGIVILWGAGANGKTTFVETIAEVSGDYAHTVSPEMILARRGAEDNLQAATKADLFGRRLVYMQETDRRRRLSEALVKGLTGGDRITACRKYENPFSFPPTHKLWLSTNHKPQIEGTDYAMWRRIHLLPFERMFGEGARDEGLRETLRAELPGVLAWAVRGCLEFQRVGLCPPEAVQKATKTYQDEQDVVGRFLADESVCGFGKDLWSSSTNLRLAFDRWCEAEGERRPDHKTLHERLRERGCEPKGKRDGKRSSVRGWTGIAVVVPDGDEPAPEADANSANGANTESQDFPQGEDSSKRSEPAVGGVGGVGRDGPGMAI